MREKYERWFVILGLITAVFAVFWQVRGFEFLNYDDSKYVSDNWHILPGLKLKNVVWVFTSEHCDNWHPLTGLSHILDCEIFGPNPGRHHLVNVMFHIINTILIFVVLERLSGAFRQSAFVAACFALHPAHVESVAWISERKDVLSTMFWFLAMWSYFHYAKNPKPGRYILTLALFAMGLMSKPMLVTLPFVFLLLDYWPLNRLQGSGREEIYRLVREKIPFLVLSAVSCVVTVALQLKTGALKDIERFSLSARVSNAAVSYVRYIGKMIWPVDLAAFYPHPGERATYWQAAGAVVLLAAVTILAVRLSGRYKYLLTGWFWYLGTLVPVIGLVQAGDQGMADRYTYVPYIGLFIIVAWGAGNLSSKLKYGQIVTGVLSSAIILILAVLTWFQAGYWRDSISLFSHAIEVTGGNYLAYNNRGTCYSQDKKRYDLAIADYTKAIEIKPDYAEALSNRGNAFKNKGEYDIAIFDFNRAVEINPNLSQVYNNRGTVYYERGDSDAAIADYNKAVILNPNYFEAYNNRGNAYNQKGLLEQAMADYNKSLAINPMYVDAYSNRGNTYKRMGRFDLAIAEYNKAIAINPRYAEAYGNRGNAYAQGLQQFDSAVTDYDKAIELNPQLVGTYLNKAIACESTGRRAEAIEAYKNFVRYASVRQGPLVEQVRRKIEEMERQ